MAILSKIHQWRLSSWESQVRSHQLLVQWNRKVWLFLKFQTETFEFRISRWFEVHYPLHLSRWKASGDHLVRSSEGNASFYCHCDHYRYHLIELINDDHCYRWFISGGYQWRISVVVVADHACLSVLKSLYRLFGLSDSTVHSRLFIAVHCWNPHFTRANGDRMVH